MVAVGWGVAAWALTYGCIHVRPGAPARWLVFVASAVIATQFGWLPLLPLLGLRVEVVDQYAAVALATVGLKVLMERALPWLLCAVEVDEVEE